jgi:hypothetical protein
MAFLLKLSKALFQYLLPTILVFIGTFDLLSKVVSLHDSLDIIHLAQASPNPSVFYHPEISAKIKFDAVLNSGLEKSATLAAGAFDLLPGPLAMRQPFAAPVFLYVPPSTVQSIYTFGVCTGEKSYLAPILGSNEQVSTLSLSVYYDNLDRPVQNIVNVNCTK